MKIVVGKRTIDVRAPYPCFCVLSHEGDSIGLIHHKDLRDLEYAISRAIKTARDMLPEHAKSEMD